ncbi:MAG TPA: hypothetical protein VIT88_04430 [Pyrinomonadaceae bacterium]
MVPAWAEQPFKQLLDQASRLFELLNISMSGISVLTAMPRVAEVLANGRKDDGDSMLDTITTVNREAELASDEINRGFPLLHAQALIALWSALEATVRLFLARLLQNHKKAWNVEAVQKLKIKLADYERAEGDDRFFYVLDRLEQELSSPIKNGVSRFESLLHVFDLSGSVEDDVRRDLFELSQLRNVLVHRSGIADRRFVEACPWLNLKVGEPIKVDHKIFVRHFRAVLCYHIELMLRVREYFGVDTSGERTQQQADSNERKFRSGEVYGKKD